MNFLTDKNINLKQLINLYQSVGWTSYTEKPELLQQAVHNSLYVLGAFDHDQLIGLIRVVGDGLTIIYIQDLLVLPAYQNKGIGSTLINKVRKEFRHVRQQVLLTMEEPETRAFYEKNGFSSCDQGELVAFYHEY
ncbi:Acetyltransferase (GNAT) domain-containing protein [Lactobacillus apis]|uniref:GNAT family N-acetyltransferase n=2 Tax=Lactobacillus TaxID=1578 RepID=UPI00081604D9|nr:GNAT family N-acetyltransferase [Lactobacillus apis]GGG41156.1 N-acetyltransferase [Lactobacillus apis]SCC03346.1 Acetyltransferase (GNAT) domain-containing protein [Lactobacillus apis]